jgi:hypothetical protein
MNTDVVHESIGKWGVGWKVGDKCRSGPESGEQGGETVKAGGVVSEGMTQSNDFACPHLLEQIFRKSCIFSIEATNVQCSKSN